MAAEIEVKRIELKRMQVRTLHVPIIGRAPLIVHKWSEKAKQEMLR
jgi:hypothetical protein